MCNRDRIPEETLLKRCEICDFDKCDRCVKGSYSTSTVPSRTASTPDRGSAGAGRIGLGSLVLVDGLVTVQRDRIFGFVAKVEGEKFLVILLLEDGKITQKSLPANRLRLVEDEQQFREALPQIESTFEAMMSDVVGLDSTGLLSRLAQEVVHDM